MSYQMKILFYFSLLIVCWGCSMEGGGVPNSNGNQGGTEAVQMEAPTIIPSTNIFETQLEVTITCPREDAVIYYTLDGSDPTTSSRKFQNPFTISETTTVKAIAVNPPFVNSEIVTHIYIKQAVNSSNVYSPVDYNDSNDGYGWGNQSWRLGAHADGDAATFAVYSKNAQLVLLEIYDNAYGTDAVYQCWMEKGTDHIWRAKINGVTNGTLYAFRCWGPNWTYDPAWQRGNSGVGFVSDYDGNGNRFNPNKVLFDPYAKELSHDKSNLTALGGGQDAGMFASGGDAYKGVPRREFDTGKYAPKSVFVEDTTSFGIKPNIAQKDALIYEAHVRGLTKHPSTANLQSILAGIEGFEAIQNIPNEYQGTYKGAGMMASYLKALGINTIELLPVHETDNDGNPDDSPGGNFWGYMTFGYFAPDRRYSSDKSYGGPTKEFKEMVKAFHDAGIEVYLDVVFNHSGEGGNWGANKEDTADILFFKGFDNSEYYALPASSPGSYWETSGCGNNLRCDNPIVRDFIVDSLTYWLDEMGVDGFRFDLATVLGRVENGGNWNYVNNAQTITEIASLGNTKNAEMIAEAWDTGTYQVGNFPDGWGEWNGRFRDTMRGYIGTGARRVGDKGDVLSYVNGDHGYFHDQGGPHKSVNFVVAHDGFTLADLCSYEGNGNAQNSTLAWPFGPSDGGNSDYNTLGFGTAPENKRQAARNYIALQMISRGVPMIVYGDELCRTQNGNNNPYNIDSVATWNNYNMINTSSPHLVSTGGAGAYHNNFGTFGNDGNVNGNFLFMKYMLNLRKNEPALRQEDYSVVYDFKKEDGGSGLTDGDRCVWIKINGSSEPNGSNYLVFSNMYTGPVNFSVPDAASGKKWVRLVDTASWAETNYNCWNASSATTITTAYEVNPWSIVILKEINQ